jgi:hypothetical protein
MPPNRPQPIPFRTNLLTVNLTLGYNDFVNPVSQAASLMGRRSVDARVKAWGKQEFERRLREWGKLGGRPKGSRKKEKKGD